MASFTVRIELHGADATDYETLHRLMESAGFSRNVTGVAPDGTRGVWVLPSAEYDFESNENAATVRDQAKGIADTVKKGSWALVTKVAERSWSTKKLG